MQSLYYLAFTFLCSLSFLSAVLSRQCNKSQYAWPRKSQKYCCSRCPPGNRMEERSETDCYIQCKPCLPGQYMDGFNLEYSCKYCQTCQESNMEYASTCNSTHNAVCKCKAGYRCNDQTCKECEQIPTTITSALPSPPATSVPSTPPQPSITTKLQPSSQDTIGLFAIIILLCAVVALIIVAKMQPLQRWIRHKLEKKPATVSTSSEDEEVSKPIQEVCGKCDQLLDV